MDIYDFKILDIKTSRWLKLMYVIQNIIMLTGSFNHDQMSPSNSQNS